MKHLKGIVESPTAPNTTDVLWLDADGGLKAFKNGEWKALVEKGSEGNSGGNSGNTAEPNIIYETDVIMYDLSTFQPKAEEGENLIKTDNLDSPFVKLNLVAGEDIKLFTILIPLQHTAFPNFASGEVTYIDMFIGKYDEIYYVDGVSYRLGISVAISTVGTLSLIAITPLKVNDVEIRVKDIYSLGEREYEFDTPFINNLKMNQFSEIYLRSSSNSKVAIRLNNVMYSGNENQPNYYDTDSIGGSYISGNYLYTVDLIIPPAATPTIRIKTYQLTPTT